MNLPNDSQRILISGKTGSGKTYAGAWHLSNRSYDKMPWIVYDFKGDELLSEIPRTKEIGVDEVPTKPGVYIVRPVPETDDDAVEQQMYRIWNQENTGVYIDEGYMISKRNKAFRALLTQGRSKRIPMITLSQRPVFLPSNFVISEADFFQIFFLNDENDIARVQGFIDGNLSAKLPAYHSYYYDVAANDGAGDFYILSPVPSKDIILETFERRLAPKRKFI